MLRIIWQKLLHKRWMVISLLIGNILLIAITVSHPMYSRASLQRMLDDEFHQYMENHNEYPALFHMSATADKRDVTGFTHMMEVARRIDQTLSVPLSQLIECYNVQESKAVSNLQRYENDGEISLKITTINGLEDHVEILSGRMYSNTITADGYIEVILSESAMVDLNLLLEEELEFRYLKDQAGNPVKLRIVGIYENSYESDPYWVKSPDTYNKDCMISYDIFSTMFLKVDSETKYNLKANWYALLQYEDISVSLVDDIILKTKQLQASDIENGKFEKTTYMSVLQNFSQNENKVTVTLLILEVPVLFLLCAFLYMISGQLLELEENEITQLKSRGARKSQVFYLYLLQSVFLSLVSFAVGLPLGSYLCRLLGSSNAFLEFVQRRPLTVHISWEVILYGLCGVGTSILMTVLPVLKLSKLSIVHVKQKKARKKRSLWQRFGFDFIAIAISLYGYYVFDRQKQQLADQVFAGESLDPILFLCASLFILGFGLFTLRFQPLLVKIIFTIRKKRLKPAAYSSFLQILRTGQKQNFIMTFLIMTVALGIFNSTVARTILANAENNEGYSVGADLVVKEVWESNAILVKYDPSIPLVYKEPDYGKYEQMEQVKAAAKVYREDDFNVKEGSKEQKVTVMGIHTKDFGLTTQLDEGLLSYDYYDYLNTLGSKTSYVLVSMNFKDKLGYALGDSITFERSGGKSMKATICGFVDYWPSYLPTSMSLSPDGTTITTQNYLIVANLSTIMNHFGLEPYEVWMRIEGSSDFFYDFAQANRMTFEKFEDLSQQRQDIRKETLFQGTNGILTMSFIVILILCCAGFLIYWVLSIRSRELLFGVFRAMGMSRRGILHMLVNEQIFTGLYSILAGTMVGLIASTLFVPLIQIAYSTSNQVLPLELLTQSSDLIRLFVVIGVVFIGCMILLSRLIFQMKISQALKLGED